LEGLLNLRLHYNRLGRGSGVLLRNP